VEIVRQLFALSLTLLLLAGNAVVCEGWGATPEARMACCSESGDCPMHEGESHEGESHDSGAHHDLTQTQADACCGAAERDQSNQSSPTFVTAVSSAVLGTAVVLPLSVPTLVLSDGWRTRAPIPIPPVPRHVLLSVFLV
jgi:hypothetical protein